MKISLPTLLLLLSGLWSGAVKLTAATNDSAAFKPNVIFILADDLGYGDLGCYGQKQIKTPCLDRMATEGMRFTQFYAGTTVCAPSRCSLMTGKHTGHTTVRGNRRPEASLLGNETTLAQVFKEAGYATALIGKWSLGGNDTPGAPNLRGFDYFFGYPSQTSAHNYYPPFLWRNNEPYEPEGNKMGIKQHYSHDLFMDEAMSFVRTNRERPFFLYLSVTIPHANTEQTPNGMQVPSDEPYSAEDWPRTEKNFAAMITRLDTGVGKLLDLIKQVGLDEKTLMLFTSDNGPHSEGGHRADFFNSSGQLRGIKRDLYEGGIRVPLIARWPGRIKGDVKSDQIGAFWDLLPTFAALTGQAAPADLDGISLLPALLEGKPVAHPPLFWEFQEKVFSRAVRMGDWKGVSPATDRPLELYDLAKDISEQYNVATEHTNVVQEIDEIMQREHVPNAIWTRMASPSPR
jgi:arylsulfatase A-like enzyme